MKLKLNQEFVAIDFFDNTRLFGIMASIKSYTFCWRINAELGMKFTFQKDNEIELERKKRKYFFKIYQWDEPNGSLKHYIYHNHYDGEYLLPEFRNMDFLWLMKGDIVDEEKCKIIINAIKSINVVQLVTELPIEQIKNKKNMII